MPDIKDANDQLVAWNKSKVKVEKQAERAAAMLESGKPFILWWADDITQIANPGEKNNALRDLFAEGVNRLDAQDRAGYKDDICKTLEISKFQWNDRLKALATVSKNGQKEGDDGEPIFHTGGWIGDHFLGLEYSPELDKTFFAVRYPDGQVEDRAERVEINGRRYVPVFANNVIRKRILLLPSEMGELKSEEELLFIIKNHNHKYFDCGSDETLEQVNMIYPFFTYLASQFRTVPYLRAKGDYGTGKTRMLETIGPICYQPIMTNAGSSASALFRILDIYPNSTLVLDEADFRDSSESSMIGKILNGGNRKGTGILKSEKNAMGNFDPEAYMVFGPKILGMRQEFDDPATTSRCITKEMLPIQPHPRISPELPPLEVYDHECLQIRNALFAYMMHNIQKDCDVDFTGVDPVIDERTKQIAVSLLTVMKSEKGKQLVLDYMRMVTEERKSDRYMMFTARVLEGLVLAWAWGPVSSRVEDGLRVYLKDIALATNMVVDEQNRRMGEDEQDDPVEGKKKPKMKSRKISNVFKKYLNIKTVRATDGLPSYKGTMFVNMEMEMERIRGLCERWGVEWLEAGSVEREKLPDESELTTKDTKSTKEHEGKTMQEVSMAFQEEREKWEALEDPERSEDSED